MKRFIISSLIVISSLTAWVGVASAHILKTDGNIGAVLHIDPADEPVAGAPASLFFEFKDKQNKFDPAKCNCQLTITEARRTVYSQPLFQNGVTPTLSNAVASYTFPKADVYKVIVTGQPLTTGSFQAFNLTYDVRVATDASNHNHSSHTIHYIFGGVVVLFVGLYLATFKKRRHA